MAVLIIVNALIVAVLGVVVCGLLRSHAEILAKLRALETGAATSPAPAPPDGQRPVPSPTAFDVVGTTLRDESVKIGIVGAKQDTLLAFLSSSSRGFWNDLAAAPPDLPGGARLVVVTRDTGEEDVARLRELAPGNVPVVLSSQAWADYGVPAAPYFIQVDGRSGRVGGEGVAQSWAQVASLWAQAVEDAAARHGSAGSWR